MNGIKRNRLYKILKEIGYENDKIAFIFIYSKKEGYIFEARNKNYFRYKEQLNSYKSWLSFVVVSNNKKGFIKSEQGVWIFLRHINDDKIFVLGLKEDWFSFFVDNYLNFFVYSFVFFLLFCLVLSAILKIL
jgi:hypothetical protein